MNITVDFIKSITFQKLPTKEKLEIKKSGRPTPDLVITQTGISNNKKYVRSFNKIWYKRHTWLCGCEKTNALFCFPCLLYGGKDALSLKGCGNLKGIKEKFEKHENSATHMENVVNLSLLGKAKSLVQPTEAGPSKDKHNEKVRRNRKILSRVIDCIRFCGKFELQLPQLIDNNNSAPALFEGVLNLMAKYDVTLQSNLETNNDFMQKTVAVRSLLPQCMLQVCRDHIRAEIAEAPFLAVIVSDVGDISERQYRTAVVFRYELRGAVRERFWGFFGECLPQTLLDEINTALGNQTHKLISQTFDVANIKYGETYVQRKIQSVYTYANFLHSYMHHPFLVLKHTTSSIPEARLFFANLSLMITYYCKSSAYLPTNKTKQEDGAEEAPEIPQLLQKDPISTIYEYKDYFKISFETLHKISTTDIAIRDAALHKQLMHDPNFILWLQFFYYIIPHVELLYNKVEVENVSSKLIKEALQYFCEAISDLQNSDLFHYSEQFVAICDMICEEAKQRFCFTSYTRGSNLFNKDSIVKYNKQRFTGEIAEICDGYKIINKEKLDSELQIFYLKKILHNYSGILDLLVKLRENDLSDVFTEITKLLEILVTSPVVTREKERCRYTVEKVRNYLSRAQNNEHPALSMMSIEHDMIENISDFKIKVFEKFCSTDYGTKSCLSFKE